MRLRTVKRRSRAGLPPKGRSPCGGLRSPWPLVPPSGSIEVLVRGRSGDPVGTYVQLILLVEDGAGPPTVRTQGPRWSAELEQGSTIFRYVELARRWGARVGNAFTVGNDEVEVAFLREKRRREGKS